MQKIHKISIGAVAVLVMLMALTPSAFSVIGFASTHVPSSYLPHSHHPQAAYESGFQHGVTDGTDGVQWYILQRGYGFAWHSSEFVTGYVNGFCSIPANKNMGSDNDRAAWDCTIGPSSVKWMIGKREPITEGVAVVTYGVPSGGMNVTYQYDDKTSGSYGSETTMAKQSWEMHFLGYTAEPGGLFPGDNVTVTVSKYVTHGLNAYGYPQSIPQPIIDNKTITLGETGGIVSLDLSKSAKGPVFSALPEAPSGPAYTGPDWSNLPQVPQYQPPPPYGNEVGTGTEYLPTPPYGTEPGAQPSTPDWVQGVNPAAVYNQPPAPSTANVPIDTSGLAPLRLFHPPRHL